MMISRAKDSVKTEIKPPDCIVSALIQNALIEYCWNVYTFCTLPVFGWTVIVSNVNTIYCQKNIKSCTYAVKL